MITKEEIESVGFKFEKTNGMSEWYEHTAPRDTGVSDYYGYVCGSIELIYDRQRNKVHIEFDFVGDVNDPMFDGECKTLEQLKMVLGMLHVIPEPINEPVNKLLELQSLCKHSLSIDVNGHRGMYLNVTEYILATHSSSAEEIGKDILDEIVKRDNVVMIFAYPNNSVGFFMIVHYDLEIAMQWAIDSINADLKPTK